MPVHVSAGKKTKKGYAVIENATGKVVAHAKTKKNAHIYAWKRNKAHEEKMAGKD